MVKVVIYTKETCPYCIKAKKILERRGVSDWEEIRVDLDPVQRDEMIKRTQRRTVPQIFIGDFHVGGCEDLEQLDNSGALKNLLNH